MSKLVALNPGTKTRLAGRYELKPILTPTEVRFYQVLQKLAEGRCTILVKPRLADFVKHHTLSDFNSISQKHVDFLICRNEDMSPIFAIELDDWTHESKRVKERDMFVNELYAAISLPLLRLPVQESGALERLIERLSNAWFRGVQLLEMRFHSRSGTCQVPS